MGDIGQYIKYWRRDKNDNNLYKGIFFKNWNSESEGVDLR